MPAQHQLTNDNRCDILEGRCSERGAAYVLALVTLLVGTVLALAMLRASGGCFLAETSRAKRMAALNLAEAGVEYAIWQVQCQQARLPYSAQVSLGEGSFQVQVTDDGTRDRSTVYITSRGTVRGTSRTIRKVALGILPYGYCWCENVNVDDGDILLTSTTGRGIRSNGSIRLTNSSTNIQAGGWSNSTFSGAGTVSPQYPNTPKIRFPEIDFGYYASIANVTFGSPVSYVDVTLTNANFQGNGGIIFVYGDIIGMQNIIYTGNWIVVCTRDIKMSCPIRAANSDSYLAILAGKDIEIRTSASYAFDRVDAIVYAPYGKINLRGTKFRNWFGLEVKDNELFVVGSMACNDFTTDGEHGTLTVSMEYDTRMNLYGLRDRLKLPGL